MKVAETLDSKEFTLQYIRNNAEEQMSKKMLLTTRMIVNVKA